MLKFLPAVLDERMVKKVSQISQAENQSVFALNLGQKGRTAGLQRTQRPKMKGIPLTYIRMAKKFDRGLTEPSCMTLRYIRWCIGLYLFHRLAGVPEENGPFHIAGAMLQG